MIKTLLLKKAPAMSSFRRYAEFNNHEYVIALTDETSGLKAFIAIHSTKLGPAHGGTRMKTYASETEALKDVLDLSKAMSYKSAMAGLPYGGAKGVIMLPAQPFDRKKLFQAYARKLESLHGLFRTGTDVGLTDADTALMSKYCQYILGLSSGEKGDLSTSKTAAIGVYYAIKTAVKYRYGSESLSGRVIGVKGVGKLGSELAYRLVDEGAKVMVSDLDQTKTRDLKNLRPGITIVDAKDIHKQEMDVYAPCALGDEFKPSVIRELACGIVAGGANNQLPTIKAGDELYKRGILYTPDYIANAGGLIFVSEDLESDGFHIERVNKRLNHISEILDMIFKRSAETSTPPHRIADLIAKERIIKGTV